jgi:aryl-alcohol dehydrogenase-like predicted oxidoreductase
MDLQGDIVFISIVLNMLISLTIRSIGVSNFSIKDLEKLLKTAKVIPAVIQVSPNGLCNISQPSD